MPGPGQKLLIISRDLLLAVGNGSSEAALVYRQLAALNRRGFYLLLTASEPDHWVPTRGSVDGALQAQVEIQERIQQAGGDLDGIYYVPRSLLTQDRNRLGALQDILRRYGLVPAQAILVSNSVPFIKAAARLGIQTREVLAEQSGRGALLAELRSL